MKPIYSIPFAFCGHKNPCYTELKEEEKCFVLHWRLRSTLTISQSDDDGEFACCLSTEWWIEWLPLPRKFLHTKHSWNWKKEMGQAAQVSKILIFLWHCCRKRNFPGVLKRTAATGSSSGRINRPRRVWWGRNNTRVVYGKWNNNSNVVRCGNGWVGGMIICICPQMALNRKKWNS